jgi:hypothetical protein
MDRDIKSNLFGYSNQINNPEIIRHIETQKSNINRFSFISLIFFPALLSIYSFFSGITLLQGLLIGLVVGILHLLGLRLWARRNYNKKSWDGIVCEKNQYKISDEKDHVKQTKNEYLIKFCGENGESHIIRNVNNDTLFNYYNKGERVRYHAGLSTVEKYDKRNDDVILCNVCREINKIERDYCKKCKYPLFK